MTHKKKKKKTGAIYVSNMCQVERRRGGREGGKAGKVTKLEKEKTRKKNKSSRNGCRGERVAREKEAGSGGSTRSGVVWRGEQRKGRRGRSGWERKSSNCFDLELSRGVTQSKRVMNSMPPGLSWE